MSTSESKEETFFVEGEAAEEVEVEVEAETEEVSAEALEDLFKRLTQELCTTQDFNGELFRAIPQVCSLALDRFRSLLRLEDALSGVYAQHIDHAVDAFRANYASFPSDFHGYPAENGEEKRKEVTGKEGSATAAALARQEEVIEKNAKEIARLKEENSVLRQELGRAGGRSGLEAKEAVTHRGLGRNDLEVIHRAIVEFLRFHHFVHTVDCFQAEAETLQIRKEDGNSAAGEDDKEAVKAKVLRAFDTGQEDELLQLWSTRVSTAANQEVAEALEFELRVHIATVLLRGSTTALDTETRALQDARMVAFKTYLQTAGQKLAQTSEYCPFYALPFAPDPPNHPSFQHVFTRDWLATLRNRLENFLTMGLEPVVEPVLHSLFSGDDANVSSASRSSAELQAKDHKTLRHRSHDGGLLIKLHSHCASVCEVIEALRSENLKKPDDRTRSLLQQICKYFDTLKGARQRVQREPEAKDEGKVEQLQSPLSDFKTVDNINVEVEPPLQALASPKSPSRSRKPRPLSPMEMPILPDLDYRQVKVDMLDLSEMSGNRPTRLLCLILQALRWRLSRTPIWRDRERVIAAISESDMLGLADEEQGGINVSVQLLQSGSPLVQEYTCRFLNYMVFHASGRRYIRSCQATVDALLAVLTSQQNQETTTFQNALGTLQKLSLNRTCALSLIHAGVMEFVVRFLLHRRNRKVSRYTADYSMALLMNLLLHQSGRDRAAQHLETSLLKLLHRMVTEGKAISFANGIIYSILRCEFFKEQLLEPSCPLRKSLTKALKHPSVDMNVKAQLEYLLMLLDGEALDPEDEEKVPESPSGSEADDEEEQLEPEVDDEEHEEMRISRTRQEFTNAAELVGERLLVFYYLKDDSNKERKRSPILKRAMPPEMASKDKLRREDT